MANGDTAAPDPKDVYLPPANPPFGPSPPPIAIGPSATNALATPPGAPDPEQQARIAAWNAQAQRLQAASAREEQLYKERKEKLDPMYDEARAASRQLASTSARATQQFLANQQQIPPYNPPGDMRQDAGNWMMLAAGFGAIAGAFSRYHTTTALNAFAGMLTGFNKGSLQAIETNYQTWEANAKRAELYNRQALTRYKAVMDNAQLNWDQKANMIKMTADQYQDAIMSSAAEQKNITQMMEIYDKQDRFAERMQFARERLEMQRDYQKNYTQRLKDRQQLNAIGAALRTDEQAEAAIGRFEPIAAFNGKVLRELAAKVNPSDWTSMNSFTQALRRIGGDADVNQFIGALESYRTELGRILNTNLGGGGALSVAAKRDADNIVLGTASPDVIIRVTKSFDQEMKYKKDLIAADKKYQQGRIDAYGTTATPPPYAPPAEPPVIPPGTTPTVSSDDIEVVE